MSTVQVLTWIQNSPLAHSVSKSNHMVGASLQIVHVVGIILLLASAVLISLRLLNIALKAQTIEQVAADATRLLWIGFALAVGSGFLMFVATPKLYYYNWAFQVKMVLVIVAVIVQQALVRRATVGGSPSLALARSSATLSLVMWFCVGFAGRVIGFI